MAAEASRAPLVRETKTDAPLFRRILTAIEPWYDWGTDWTIWRLDRCEPNFADESEGPAYHFELQWFGLHFACQVGRVPPKVPAEEVAERKRIAAEHRTARLDEVE